MGKYTEITFLGCDSSLQRLTIYGLPASDTVQPTKQILYIVQLYLKSLSNRFHGGFSARHRIRSSLLTSHFSIYLLWLVDKFWVSQQPWGIDKIRKDCFPLVKYKPDQHSEKPGRGFVVGGLLVFFVLSPASVTCTRYLWGCCWTRPYSFPGLLTTCQIRFLSNRTLLKIQALSLSQLVVSRKTTQFICYTLPGSLRKLTVWDY